MILSTLMAFSFVILAKGIFGLWDIFVGTVYSLGYSSGINQLIQRSLFDLHTSNCETTTVT